MKLESPLKEQYGKDRKSILEAQRAAQEIAFGPIVFQVSRMMVKLNVFQTLSDNPSGLTHTEIAANTKLSGYAVKVLLEASLSIGTITTKDDKFYLSKTGWYLLNDKMTQVNMNFVQDVNYLGFFNLEKALKDGHPEGLKIFGNWPTIYQGLSTLPGDVKKSWFDFDHFYSDSSFDAALKIVFEDNPSKILDVGGNTGRWATQCVNHNENVKVTVMDLPQQLEMLKENTKDIKGCERIDTLAADVLDSQTVFPQGYNAVWMSQFLDCFSEEQILSILTRAKNAIVDNGHLYIMETFWNRQQYETASYCLTLTSLYFTVMANGNSKMYHSDDMKALIEKAGFEVEEIFDNLAFGHSIVKAKPIKN